MACSPEYRRSIATDYINKCLCTASNLMLHQPRHHWVWLEKSRARGFSYFQTTLYTYRKMCLPNKVCVPTYVCTYVRMYILDRRAQTVNWHRQTRYITSKTAGATCVLDRMVQHHWCFLPSCTIAGVMSCNTSCGMYVHRDISCIQHVKCFL